MIKDTIKDKRGQYMKKYTSARRSQIMSERATQRWAKTTKVERVAYAHKLVLARQLKNEKE